MNTLQSLKIVRYLLGQLSVTGREDVQRLNACFTQLDALVERFEQTEKEE